MKTLLLFPDTIYYDHKSEEFYSNLRQSVDKLAKVAKNLHWDLHCLFSDEVALIERPERVTWLNTMSDSDLFFMEKHNDVMSRIPLLEGEVERFDALYAKALEKYPVTRKLSEDERFDLACKRESFVKKRIFKTFSSFIIFGSMSHSTYPIKPKENDGRFIMYIDLVFFKADCYINGTKVVNSDVLHFGTANNTVYSWEV